MEQRVSGTRETWVEPLAVLRIPKLYNIRTDPFERADVTSNVYWDWHLRKGYLLRAIIEAIVKPLLESFKEYPPRQKATSFTIDSVLAKVADTFKSRH